MFSHLEDLAEISGNNTHLEEKAERLNKSARQTGLNISTKKTKIMTINTTHEPITINNDPLAEVEDFTYLGSVLSKDNGTGKRHQGQALISTCSIRQTSSGSRVNTV